MAFCLLETDPTISFRICTDFFPNPATFLFLSALERIEFLEKNMFFQLETGSTTSWSSSYLASYMYYCCSLNVHFHKRSFIQPSWYYEYCQRRNHYTGWLINSSKLFSSRKLLNAKTSSFFDKALVWFLEMDTILINLTLFWRLRNEKIVFIILEKSLPKLNISTKRNRNNTFSW